ncbi:MAG TPA: hypothetical protein VD861_15620 [Pyrinomonadaceae bacterium]|nr:hypothetical protein [Pyrinomonadaceae bacterium]
MNEVKMNQLNADGSAPVHRSKETLGLGIVGGVVLGCLSLYLWNTQHEVWGLLAAVLALVVALVGLTLSWKANCPVCRAPLNGLSSGVCGPCGNCMHYLKIENKRIFPLEEDYSASTPMFAIPWDSLDRTPQRCCGCGQQAVRVEAISSLAFRGLSLSAQMPHCALCSKGAYIKQADKVTSDSLSATPETYISVVVRSHRFYHDVMMMNHGAYSSRG